MQRQAATQRTMRRRKGRKVLVEIPRVGVGGVGRKNARPSEYVTYGIVFAGYNRAVD